MRATGGFSKVSWGVYTSFQEALEKPFLAPMRLKSAIKHNSRRV
jgi:hypothetical protein